MHPAVTEDRRGTRAPRRARFVPPTDSAQAASTGTGWQSTLTTQPFIRVDRTDLGHAVTVDFMWRALPALSWSTLEAF
jgi:hypothetical protein